MIHVITDIHGFLNGLDSLLNKVLPLKCDDQLVFLGDYIDRGPDSIGVLKRIYSLIQEYGPKVTILWGNHEEMYANYMGLSSPGNPGEVSKERRERSFDTWWANGGKEALANTNDVEFHTAFLNLYPHFKLFYKVETPTVPLIFVHASLNPRADLNNLTESNKLLMLWSGTSRTDRENTSRILVCGHIPQQHRYINMPYYICIDSGSFVYRKLTCLSIDPSHPDTRIFSTTNL